MAKKTNSWYDIAQTGSALAIVSILFGTLIYNRSVDAINIQNRPLTPEPVTAPAIKLTRIANGVFQAIDSGGSVTYNFTTEMVYDSRYKDPKPFSDLTLAHLKAVTKSALAANWQSAHDPFASPTFASLLKIIEKNEPASPEEIFAAHHGFSPSLEGGN